MTGRRRGRHRLARRADLFGVGIDPLQAGHFGDGGERVERHTHFRRLGYRRCGRRRRGRHGATGAATRSSCRCVGAAAASSASGPARRRGRLDVVVRRHRHRRLPSRPSSACASGRASAVGGEIVRRLAGSAVRAALGRDLAIPRLTIAAATAASAAPSTAFALLLDRAGIAGRGRGGSVARSFARRRSSRSPVRAASRASSPGPLASGSLASAPTAASPDSALRASSRSRPRPPRRLRRRPVRSPAAPASPSPPCRPLGMVSTNG